MEVSWKATLHDESKPCSDVDKFTTLLAVAVVCQVIGELTKVEPPETWIELEILCTYVRLILNLRC